MASSKHKKHKHDKEEKKSSSKHKKHKHDKEEKKSKHKHKSKKHKSHRDRDRDGSSGDSDGGGPRIMPSEVVDAKDDYFRKNDVFKVWLHRGKGVAFEDLTGDDSRALFAKFAKLWNAGKLEAMYVEWRRRCCSRCTPRSLTSPLRYYDGPPEDVVAACRKTTHTWGMKLSGKDRDDLQRLRDTMASEKARESGAAAAAAAPPAMRRDRERAHFKDTLAAVAPKETGRDAKAAKRKEVGSKLHGAAQDAEDARDGMENPGLDVMGGGGADEFKRMVRGKRQRTDARGERHASLLADHAAKEKSQRDAMIAALGLKPGEKLQIRPR